MESMMPIEQKFIRCAEDDPNRCQAFGRNGQCPFRAVEGGHVCQRHGGNTVENRVETANLRNYYLTRYHEKVARLSNQPEIKSLRDEIGIVRMIVESKLNAIEDDTDLMLQSGQISDLVMKIKALVESCDKIDFRMGQLLDKKYIEQFAQSIITIITEELDDDEKIEVIITRILEAIECEAKDPK